MKRLSSLIASLIYFAFILSATTVFAQTTAQDNTGMELWTDASDWDNGIPSCAGETTVIIPSGVTMIIRNTDVDLTSCAMDITIENGGILRFGNTGTNTSTLNLGPGSTVTVETGGTIDVGGGDAADMSITIDGTEVWSGSDGDATGPWDSTPTFTTTTDGDWDDGATWGNTSPGTEGTDYPGSSDNASIAGSHDVTIPAGVTASCASLTMNSDANNTTASTLTLSSSTASLTVTNDFTVTRPSAQTTTTVQTIDMNGGTITVNGDLYLEADRRVSGGAKIWDVDFRVDGGTLTVAGDINLRSDHSGADSEIDLSTAGSTLNIGGNFVELGTGNRGQLLTLGTNCTVNFDGSGAQNVPGQIGDTQFDYDNLTLSGSGAKTLEEDITVNDVLSMQGTATMALGGNNLTYGGSSSLEYAGSSTQTAGDEMSASNNVQTLIINNGSGVILSADETIDDAITLTSGVLTLGTYDIVMGTANSVSTGSASTWIATTSTGYLEIETSGATGYPVGTASYYDPVIITPTTDATFQVRVESGPNNSPNDATKAIQLEWEIHNSAGTPGSTTLRLAWDRTNQEGANFQANDGTVILGHYTGGKWEETLATYTENSPAGRSQAVADGFTSFSPFGVGGGFGSLPIELVDFSAYYKDDVVELIWSTETEINNDYYTIERSADGKDWEEILEIPGAGNSNMYLEYYEQDIEPLSGLSYYRLKQTDYDGAYEYFNMVPVNVNMEKVYADLQVFPNPIAMGENLVLDFSEDFISKETLVVIRDVQGREFYSKALIDIDEGSTLHTLQIDEHIPPGLYMIIATSNDAIYSKRLMVK